MDILVLGTIRGALYALLSVGFALVFSAGGVLNLAHGAYYMLGAYFTYIFVQRLFAASGTGGLIAGTVAAVVTTGLAGLFLFYVLLKRLRVHTEQFILAMSLSASLFAGELFAQYFGVAGVLVPTLVRGSSEILGVQVIHQELLVLPVAAVVLGLLWWFLRYTKTGRGILALAQDREGAVLLGIEPERTLAVVMFLSAALAGLAGALISGVRSVLPTMWIFALIKAFAIVIVGGLGSLTGAVAGALILGIAEVATALYFGEQFTELVSMALIVVILLVRPAGLFAK